MMVYSATVVSIRGLELAQPSPTNLHVKRRLHDTTGCPTGCQTGLIAGWTTGCIVYTNIQPVVQPVV